MLVLVSRRDCAVMMGPKERVLRAIEHRETDRVPLDFGANPGTMERLKRDLCV